MSVDLRDFSSLPVVGFIVVVAGGVTVVVLVSPDDGKRRDIVVLLHGVWRRSLVCAEQPLSR